MSYLAFFRGSFFAMFGSIFLLSLNFTILRSVRNTLAIVDLGSGSHTIPLFELFGALPAAILITWLLLYLMNRFSLQRVFMISLAGFMTFFVVFSLVLYPLVKGTAFQGCFAMLFYVMSELWKPVLINMLFWGLLNSNMPLSDAKKLYAPLFFGASLGGLFAGPILKLCNLLSSHVWSQTLLWIVLVLVISGVLAGLLFFRLGKIFSQKTLSRPASTPFSFHACVKLCLSSKPLLFLSCIVLADYIAYSLGEVIFLDFLKKKFPDPCDYCSYLGALSSWSSVLTIIIALGVAPLVLQRCHWVVGALILPLILLVIEGTFFFFLRGKLWFGWTELQWIESVVLLGSLQFSVCRALKYTLFDASKELAFVFLPSEQKIQGKFIVDGISARLGRGSSSALSLGLIYLCGGVFASSLITGIFSLVAIGGWILATKKLGKELDKETVYV